MADAVALDGSILPRVIAAGQAEGRELRIEPYTLAFGEIDLLTAGRILSRLNGQDFPCEAGNAYSFRVGDVYSARGDVAQGTVVCRWVRFAWSTPTDQRDALLLPRICAMSAQRLPAAIAIYDRLFAAQAGSGPGAALAGVAALLDLIALLREAAGGRPIDRRLARGLAHLESHLARPLRIREAAAAAGMSEDAFARACRREIGKSPLQHLIALRLEAARRLLVAEPRTAVAEAARRCGFDDADHFARLFRRRFGAAPREFRSRMGGP